MEDEKRLAAQGLDLTTWKARKRDSVTEMDRVVPWAQLVVLIKQNGTPAKTGRPSFPIETILHIHFLQQRFCLSDPVSEKTPLDVPMYRKFAQLPYGLLQLSDENTISRFRHPLQTHWLATHMFSAGNASRGTTGLMLETSSVVDFALISPPSLTKNNSSTRNLEMQQSKMDNNGHFGMKTYIAVDSDVGLVHHQVCVAANVHDLRVVDQLLHHKQKHALSDSGYRGVVKRSRRKRGRWAAVKTPRDCRIPDPSKPLDALQDHAERIKAGIRSKVEHPLRVRNSQFGHAKAHDLELDNNAHQFMTLLML